MSIWQTKKWWEMLVKSWQAEKIIEINGIFIEKRKVWLGEYGLFVIWITSPYLSSLWGEGDKLIELCKKEKALFIQVEDICYSNKTSPPTPLLSRGEGSFKEWYYKKFITPYTAVIDLNLKEEEILSNMKPKWRYNIKLAEKKWIEVKKVEKTDDNIKKFYDLVVETTLRDKFSWNTLKYYKTFLNFIDDSELLLAFSEDNKIIAWWIFIFQEEVSVYYYWASTSIKEYRNLMAPYLLQWEAIKIAKKRWSKIYDFLWVASVWEENSSLEWVTDFKLKLTKEILKVSGSYIWINKKFKYNLLHIFRKIKNLFS